MTEMAVDDEIRIGGRRRVGERGNIKEFSATDQDLLQDRPESATERFIEAGDPGIPVKPIR